MIRGATLFAVCFIAGLGGCAMPLQGPSQGPSQGLLDASGDGGRLWVLHRVRVEAVLSWQLEGKVSIRRADRLWGAGLNWSHDEGGDILSLRGPGGRMLARLRSRPHGASAVDSRGRRYEADTFEELAAEIFGVEMPVSSLRYWIAGVPDPDAKIESMRVDRDGRMEALDQGGWRVRYLDYQIADAAPARPLSASPLPASPLVLPSLLALTRGGLEVTVAANHWRLLRFNHAVEQAL